MFTIKLTTESARVSRVSVDEIQQNINYHLFIIDRKKSNLDEGGLIFINNLRISNSICNIGVCYSVAGR